MAVSDFRGVMIANGDGHDGHVAGASSRSAGGKLPEGGWQPKDQTVVKIYTFNWVVVTHFFNFHPYYGKMNPF